MMGRLRLALRFVKGLSLLGITAIVSRVARNTFETLLMQDVGPAVMGVFRRVAYGVRDFFGGIFSGGRNANVVYTMQQAAA